MKKGILICGHGSRDPQGVEHFRELVNELRLRHPEMVVDYGFLEFAHPVYAAAVERMYTQGVREILAIPAILFAGGHAKNDIPYEMNTLQQQYPDLKIRLGKHIGITPALLRLSGKLIAEAHALLPAGELSDTCLVVVGRGTSDPDANSDIAKLTRMLWEGMGFGFATTTYIGVTTPLLEDTLALMSNLPFRRVIVFPVFLFTGVLLKKIQTQTEAFAATSGKEVICAASYGCDPLLLDAIDERILELEGGSPAMNCQLCKYRTQIIGYEAEAGKAQTGHHLSVRGILFEEEEKPGENKGLRSLKKLFGI